MTRRDFKNYLYSLFWMDSDGEVKRMLKVAPSHSVICVNVENGLLKPIHANSTGCLPVSYLPFLRILSIHSWLHAWLQRQCSNKRIVYHKVHFFCSPWDHRSSSGGNENLIRGCSIYNIWTFLVSLAGVLVISRTDSRSTHFPSLEKSAIHYKVN